MREIITLGIGNCGINLINEFYRGLNTEHGIASNGFAIENIEGKSHSERFDKIESFYRTTEEGQLLPRAMLIDTDPQKIDEVFEEDLKNFYDQKFCYRGKGSACSNFGKGHYIEIDEFSEAYQDGLRRLIEECDNFKGFYLFRSTNGGTGGGVGSVFLNKCREYYCDKKISDYAVMYSPDLHHGETEAYNSVLSFHSMIDYSDLLYMIQNEALYKNLSILGTDMTPGFDKYNKVISNVACDISSSVRFPSEVPYDQYYMSSNLVLFPRLHLFVVSYNDFVHQPSKLKTGNYENFYDGMHNGAKTFMSINKKTGKILSLMNLFRGEISPKIISDLHKKTMKEKDRFRSWQERPTSYGKCDIAARGHKLNGVQVMVNDGIQEQMKKLQESFLKLFEKKVFLHPYIKDAGMDEMEFAEAESNLADFISELQEWGLTAGCGGEEHESSVLS